MMNIVFSVIIFIITAFIRVKYRPKGKISNRMFLLSIVIGITAAFSSPSFSSAWMSAATCVCLAGYAAQLLIYALDSRSQARVRTEQPAYKGKEATKKSAPDDQATLRTIRLRGGRILEIAA